MSSGNELYNLGEERAQRIWDLHKETFLKYDAIITSDTAPLARIFLQNDWPKPLIIWICNRFDYSDQASLDCDFPDEAYYELFRKATALPNVKVIAYTEFEHHYANKQGVDTGSIIITPSAFEILPLNNSAIPSHIVKNETFFLPPYHNETQFMDMQKFLSDLGIPVYCGRYNGARDLEDFKGIIHFPYAWSNLALFENLSLGIPYFLPSEKFFVELVTNNSNYFFTNPFYIIHRDFAKVSEWYAPLRKDIFIYFDSWEDLLNKIENTDYAAKRDQIKNHSIEHNKKMKNRWTKAFKDLGILQ